MWKKSRSLYSSNPLYVFAFARVLEWHPAITEHHLCIYIVTETHGVSWKWGQVGKIIVSFSLQESPEWRFVSSEVADTTLPIYLCLEPELWVAEVTGPTWARVVPWDRSGTVHIISWSHYHKIISMKTVAFYDIECVVLTFKRSCEWIPLCACYQWVSHIQSH